MNRRTAALKEENASLREELQLAKTLSAKIEKKEKTRMREQEVVVWKMERQNEEIKKS